jgi:hypothetical protein
MGNILSCVHYRNPFSCSRWQVESDNRLSRAGSSVLPKRRVPTRIWYFNFTMNCHNQNHVKLMQNFASAIILDERRWLCRTCFTHVLPTWHQQNTILEPFPSPTPSNKCSCANATETNSTDLQVAVNNPTPVRTARWQGIWHSLACPCVDWEKRTGVRALGEYGMGGQSTIQGPQTARVLQLGPMQTAL